MKSLVRPLSRLFLRPAWQPLKFASTGYDVLDSSQLLEEERLEGFKEGLYYPVNVGDVFQSKYQVVGKLGFGTTSTVWLARDMQKRQHVAMKFYTRNGVTNEEYNIYSRVSKANPSHPGHKHVRTALDLFTIERPEGNHFCLVQRPTWDSFGDLLYRNSTHRFSPALLKSGLVQVFSALDYLHTECRLVHTDIKADNIMIEIEDQTVLEVFVAAELETPSPRKIVDGKPVYLSRRFAKPKVFGNVVLGDLGEAIDGDEKRNHNAQPDVYRSPEVMLKADWSYAVDIWNAGVLIWDLFECKHMFYGNDPDGKGYSTRAHLAEVIGMLGPPPVDLVRQGSRSPEFFNEDGSWRAEVEIRPTSLEDSEQYLKDQDKEAFLKFIKGMLQWAPRDRRTAAELLNDPWLRQ